MSICKINIKLRFWFSNKINKISYKDQIEMKYYYEPHLTLQGLYLIGLKKYA